MREMPAVVLVLFLVLGAGTSAYADCCDSILDCAATVATEGVSCAVQEFISEVKGLVNLVNNLMSGATRATQDATRSAQQLMDDTINQTTSQSQSSSAEIAQAAQQGVTIAKEETIYRQQAEKVVSGTNATTNTAAPATSSNPASAAQTAVSQRAMTETAVERNRNLQAANSAPTAGNRPPQSEAMKTNTTPATTANTTTTSRTAVIADLNQDLKHLAAPPNTFKDELARASAEINKQKIVGDQDLAKVNQFMATAKQTEGSGVKSALGIANQAIEAPFNNLLSQLTAMLSNPTDLTNPSSAVEAMANSIMSNVDVNINQVVNSITAGPLQAFQSAQPSHTDLQNRAEYAQQIAKAMDVLYRDRTPAALQALDSLLPKSTSVAPTTVSQYHGAMEMKNHVAYADVLTTFTSRQQKTKMDFKQRFQAFSMGMTRYKSVRAKALNMRASMGTYRSNFSQKLNASFAGKTQAEINAQREQLIAQARTQFAKDPKTRDAVINLLNSEISKVQAVQKH